VTDAEEFHLASTVGKEVRLRHPKTMPINSNTGMLDSSAALNQKG
jgi:hypothetical protein